MLLLKRNEAAVDGVSLRARYVVQRVLVDGSRPLLLLALLLKLRKLDEQLLLQHAQGGCLRCFSYSLPDLDVCRLPWLDRDRSGES